MGYGASFAGLGTVGTHNSIQPSRQACSSDLRDLDHEPGLPLIHALPAFLSQLSKSNSFRSMIGESVSSSSLEKSRGRVENSGC